MKSLIGQTLSGTDVVEYPSGLISRDYAHRHSARIINMLFFCMITALFVSIIINLYQPVVSLIKPGFFTKNAAVTLSGSPRGADGISLTAVTAAADSKNGKINAAISSMNNVPAMAVNHAKKIPLAMTVADKAFLKANTIRNEKVVKELVAVTDMMEFSFETSSYRFEESKGNDKLDQSIQKYIQAPESWTKMIILGFTDNRGAKLHNVKIGMKRAEHLKALLIKKGIPAEKITIASFGQDLPIASNYDEEGRMRNRRVELNIVGADNQ